MFAFALLAAATLHDPNPDDIHRFGFNVCPATESHPRRVWNAAREQYYQARQPVSGWLIYGREQQHAEMVLAAEWTERVWDAVDDMARSCCSWECRMYAARRLQSRLGVVPYYLGELPPVKANPD